MDFEWQYYRAYSNDFMNKSELKWWDERRAGAGAGNESTVACMLV